MFYDLNENTEKLVTIQGIGFFVPYSLPDDISKMIQEIGEKDMLKAWNEIAKKLLGLLNDSVPELTHQGVRDFISVIDKY
jgi:hypothetical protein